MNLTEEEAVKAIQTLLFLSGIKEPEVDTRIKWREMSEEEKNKTEAVYKSFLKMVH